MTERDAFGQVHAYGPLRVFTEPLLSHSLGNRSG
jgi:hypothetical protein